MRFLVISLAQKTPSYRYNFNGTEVFNDTAGDERFHLNNRPNSPPHTRFVFFLSHRVVRCAQNFTQNAHLRLCFCFFFLAQRKSRRHAKQFLPSEQEVTNQRRAHTRFLPWGTQSAPQHSNTTVGKSAGGLRDIQIHYVDPHYCWCATTHSSAHTHGHGRAIATKMSHSPLAMIITVNARASTHLLLTTD